VQQHLRVSTLATKKVSATLIVTLTLYLTITLRLTLTLTQQQRALGVQSVTLSDKLALHEGLVAMHE
jgi:hypothetical protein